MKNGKILLFVYFQFFEIWNIITVTGKWIFRLLKYLTHFAKLFQEFFCLLVHIFRNWQRMTVLRIIEKYLKVFLFDCEEGKLHDVIGIVNDKGLSFRCLYCVSSMLAHSVCIYFSHRSHKTAESVSLTSLLLILEKYSERDMGMVIKFYWWEMMWMTDGCQFYLATVMLKILSYQLSDRLLVYLWLYYYYYYIYCSYIDYYKNKKVENIFGQ